MSTRTSFLLLAVPAALVACSSNPAADRPLTSSQSFVVHGQLTLTRGMPGGVADPLPTQQDFVLRVDPAGRTSLAGVPGQAALSTLTSADGVAFRTNEPLTLALPQEICRDSVTYADFHFTASPDALAGTATGTAWLGQGDVVYDYAARLVFTGVPDTAGPSLAGTGADLDPLSSLLLTASEPLPANATAQMVGPGQPVDLTADLPAGAGAATGFTKPFAALRYGATYSVVVDPWTDLAGNPGTTIDDITTVAPPPLAAEDGFEDAGATIGGATVVDATIMPPIGGQKSVILNSRDSGLAAPPAPLDSTRLTVRLAVSPGDRFVRFSLRPFSRYATPVGTYGTSIKVAVPGGEITSVALPGSETLAVQPPLTGGAQVLMGDVRPMEAALPAGATDEVVFDFEISPPSGACGLPAPTASYLVDDLRVE